MAKLPAIPLLDIQDELSNLKYLPPTWVMWAVGIFTCVALIPLGLIIKSRFQHSNIPRIHIIQDMDQQPKIRAQLPSNVFADGRATRPTVPGTVARSADSLQLDDHYYRGVVTGADGQPAWATTFPAATGQAAQVKVTDELMNRGEARYNVYCSPCHGFDGQGKGTVPMRAAVLKQAFTAPANLTEAPVTEREVGHLFNTITNGNNNMKAYGHMIPVQDRWAIVAWVKVLQRHRNATLTDLEKVPDESVRQKIAAELQK
ncbi:MAG: cytochrome c [Planctomycetota bacterium]